MKYIILLALITALAASCSGNECEGDEGGCPTYYAKQDSAEHVVYVQDDAKHITK